MTKFCADVFTFIFVTILLCGEKCYSLSEDEFIVGTRHEVRGFNQNDQADIPIKWRVFNSIPHHGLGFERVGNRPSAQDLLTKLKTAASSSKAFSNAPRWRHPLHQSRIVRQAYTGHQTHLYPTLPPPPNSYPTYQPHISNYNKQNQTGYTPPYNPQYNPGYPGQNPSYNGYNTNRNQSPYNPNFSPYNPTPSAPVAPRPPPNNQYGPAYPNTFNNFNNSRPQNMPGYQPYPGSNFNNVNPGHQPSHGFGNNTAYNPSQRPPYSPSGNNSFNPHQPNYSPYTTTQRIPNNFPNQFGTHNSSGSPNYRPGSMPNNTSYVNYPVHPNRPKSNGPYNNGPSSIRPGYGPTQSNSTASPSTYQSGRQNSSYNGFPYNNNNYNANYPSGYNVNNYPNNNQGRPFYPGQNNFTRPTAGVGYNPNGYNSQNMSIYGPNVQTNGQLPGVYYPQYQNNGTNTYRLADHYTPNIPSQPPPRNNYGGHNSFYPSNPTHDPTRVSPQRFSY